MQISLRIPNPKFGFYDTNRKNARLFWGKSLKITNINYLNPPFGCEICGPKTTKNRPFGAEICTQTEGLLSVHAGPKLHQVWSTSKWVPLIDDPWKKNKTKRLFSGHMPSYFFLMLGWCPAGTGCNSISPLFVVGLFRPVNRWNKPTHTPNNINTQKLVVWVVFFP